MGIATGLAARLTAAARQAGQTEALRVANDVARRAEALAPVVDAQDDPDPSVSLRRGATVRAVPGGAVVEFDQPYALRQHENLHLKHPRGGGPKFLDRAVREVTAGLPQRFGRALGVEVNQLDRAGRSAQSASRGAFANRGGHTGDRRVAVTDLGSNRTVSGTVKRGG